MNGFYSKRGRKHCVYCNTPIDIWEPLDSYKDDNCCKFYSDVWDIADTIEKKFGRISKRKLVESCEILKDEYKDIPNFHKAVIECYDSFVDLGIFMTDYI